MKSDICIVGIVAVVLSVLTGYSAYPSMDRAMELFGTNIVCTTGVSLETEAYSEFAMDLNCQTTSENARSMETFLLSTITSIVVTVSTNAINDGTSVWLMSDRGSWFSAAARNFHDLPTNPANSIAVATYLGTVHRVDFPTNLIFRGFCTMQYLATDPAKMEAYKARRKAWRAALDLQRRVKSTNEAVDEYRRDLLSICNVGVRGCRGIMDDAQFCAFTNQLVSVSGASEAERRVLFDSIPSQDEGE